MVKPQNYKQLFRIVGKQVKISQENGGYITGVVTGFNTSRKWEVNTNDELDEIADVWFYINGKPKSYRYEWIELLDKYTAVENFIEAWKDLPLWIKIALVNMGIITITAVILAIKYLIE